MNLRTWVEKSVGHFVSARLFKITGLDPLMEGSEEELHRALHEAVQRYPGVFPRDVVRLAEMYHPGGKGGDAPANEAQKSRTEGKGDEAAVEVVEAAEEKVTKGKSEVSETGKGKRKGGK